MKSFFTFRRFISPAIIGALFWAGTFILFLLWCYRLLTLPFQLGSFLKSSIGILLFASIWRIICERLILHFRIYDRLNSLANYFEKEL